MPSIFFLYPRQLISSQLSCSIFHHCSSSSVATASSSDQLSLIQRTCICILLAAFLAHSRSVGQGVLLVLNHRLLHAFPDTFCWSVAWVSPIGKLKWSLSVDPDVLMTSTLWHWFLSQVKTCSWEQFLRYISMSGWRKSGMWWSADNNNEVNYTSSPRD